MQGTGAAVISSGRNDLICFGYDDIYTTCELVRAGIIKFVVCQQPERQGYHAVKRAYQALSGLIPTSSAEDFITDTLIKIRSNLD